MVGTASSPSAARTSAPAIGDSLWNRLLWLSPPGKIWRCSLTAAGRTRPAAVISWHPEQPENRIDVEHIAREIGDLADVFWLENGPESYAFGDSLPSGVHVFGNAARVYAEDLRWMADVHRSPLRMARDRRSGCPRGRGHHRGRAEPDHRGSAEGSVRSAPCPGASGAPSRLSPAPGSRAIVELGDGSCCTIQREHVSPPVRLDWMLELGQSVEGDLNDDDKTLDIKDLRTAPRLADLYRSGTWSSPWPNR